MEKGQLIYNVLVGAGLVLATTLNVLNHKPQKLVSVDSQYLVDTLKKDLASQAISDKEMEPIISQYISDLDARIKEIAKERGVVVLVSKAVLAGTTDITKEVAQSIGGTK